MKRRAWISFASGLMLVGMVAFACTFTWAQIKGGLQIKGGEQPKGADKPKSPKAEPSAGTAATPLALLPEATVLLISADGDAAHKAGWEKTAAYEAFRQSGLLDSVSKLVHEVVGHIPGDAKDTLEIFEFISDHGLTAAISLPPEGAVPIPLLTVVIHDAAPHVDAVGRLVGRMNPQIKMVQQKASGRMLSRAELPGTAGFELAWWAEGKHLVVAVGVGVGDTAIAVADGKSPNFAAAAAGKKLLAKPAFDRTGLLWFNAAILRNRLGAMPLPSGEKTIADVIDALGLESLNHVLVQSGYKDRSLWSTIDVDAPGPRKGLMGLADPKSSMTLKDLPPLPSMQAGFAAHSLSLVKVYDTLLAAVRDVVKLGRAGASEELDEMIEQLPQVLGFDLREDLLAPLGSVHCVYSDWNQGFLWPDHGLVLSVSDAPKLQATVAKLLDRVGNEVSEEHLTIVQRKKYGQKLITLQTVGGAFNPSLVITDKWLCIGLSSQTVESFVLRMKGDFPSWKVDAETAEVLAIVPPKFASISVAYPRQSVRGLIAAAPLLMGIAQAAVTQASQWGQMPRIDFSEAIQELPPAEVVIAPLFPNVSWSVVDESGIHVTTRSSAPAIPLMNGVDGSTIAAVAIAGALLVPATTQARAAAQRTQSMNNLKQISLALLNYESANRMFPSGTIPSKKLKPEERQSWMVPLLPYLEDSPLYERMEVNLRESALWNDERLKGANQTTISIFVNPAQPKGFEPGEPATTDYAGWAGVGKDAPTEKSKPEKKGIFGYDRATRFTEVTDGMSHTVMVSEVVAKDRGPWAQGGTATIRALTARPYINGVDGIGGPYAGGFIVAICDGSVRFVSEKIDPDILEKLATRAGGEIITDY